MRLQALQKCDLIQPGLLSYQGNWGFREKQVSGEPAGFMTTAIGHLNVKANSV